MSQAARGLELLATGAAIEGAKDIKFFVHVTVLLIAQSLEHSYNVLAYKYWYTNEHTILRGNKPPLS